MYNFIRHRHHNSLDSLNQQQPTTTTTTTPNNKRSSSLSIDQNNSFNYPTTEEQTTTTTTQTTTKRPQSKLSLVAAIPASILKKDKPGLLSQEQKRANHIASEQKRRAAIRQGYNRLCLIVPSLRTTLTNSTGGDDQVTIRRSEDGSPFDDQSTNTPASHDDSNSSSNTFKRKRNKQLPFESNRPAPRSEAVVLAKTVEYLRELESERNTFLEKLESLKMLAISKGIPINHNNNKRVIYKNGTKMNRPNKLQEEEEEEEEEEGEEGRERSKDDDSFDQERLQVWQDKWYGNIHQIDLKLNNLNQDESKQDHHNHHHPDQNLKILDLNSNLIHHHHHLSPPPLPLNTNTNTNTNTSTFIQNSSLY